MDPSRWLRAPAPLTPAKTAKGKASTSATLTSSASKNSSASTSSAKPNANSSATLSTVAAPAISIAPSRITASRCKPCAPTAIVSSTAPAPTSPKKISRRSAKPSRILAPRGGSLKEQIQKLFKKIGREFWPLRENLHLSDEQKANAVKKVAVDASTLLGRKVVSIDRTDGAKFIFDDGTWMLMRLSGTEPLLRLYVEAGSAAASARLAREATEWVLKS